tara:strand:+ start:4103 stop:5107 length:1005 start_codon:yes stop_codon:yes gene_type:complete
MEHLRIHPEVQQAMSDGSPVVLLETAVTTRGLPRSGWTWQGRDAISDLDPDWNLEGPVNLELATAMSRCVRREGATPATVAIMDGQWHIGLEMERLVRLAGDETAGKASITSIAAALQSGASAGTTVSGALIAASLMKRIVGQAPLVLATGGIGGVHFGWSRQPDVSADLKVMADTPVIVVSAGVKSIVDVVATREWLETLGVPVMGLGTEDFPCFITGVDENAPGVLKVDSESDAARIASLHWNTVDPNGGLLLAVPLDPSAVLDADLVRNANDEAEASATAAGVDGPDRTPHLLSHMAKNTDGRSLIANIQLLLANAKVAARLAGSLASEVS